MENSNREAMNKPVQEEEMYILKELEDVQMFISVGKQNGQKGTIQHNYNNDDLLQGKNTKSLSTFKMNNKCLMK